MVGLVLVFFSALFLTDLAKISLQQKCSIVLESDSIIVENFGLLLMFLMNKIRGGAWSDYF